MRHDVVVKLGTCDQDHTKAHATGRSDSLHDRRKVIHVTDEVVWQSGALENS